MDWTNIVMTLISSGAFLGLFLITERKTAAAMKNTQSQSAEWERLYKEEKADNDLKDAKISELIKEKDNLRDERDAAIRDKNDAFLYSARASVLRCECINCEKRIPPIDLEKITGLRIEEEIMKQLN